MTTRVIPQPSLKLTGGPSPVFRLKDLERGPCELWIKNDGALNPIYGGNKVRKLEWLLSAERLQGGKRLFTAGAAGSHHVLATALFGQYVGLPTAAVLCPQPSTLHARETLLRSVAILDQVYPCASMIRVPATLLKHRRPSDIFIPIGGSSLLGTRGYALAIDELMEQVRRGELPRPDIIVTALGSGGTAAGLLAGLLRWQLQTKICAVQVLRGSTWARLNLLSLALGQSISAGGRWAPLQASSQLWVSDSQVGAGYGHPTSRSRHAITSAAECGLTLDPTYTSKAFAEVLEIIARVQRGLAYCPVRPWQLPAKRPLRILYWHTLSSVHSTCIDPIRTDRASLVGRLLSG